MRHCLRLVSANRMDAMKYFYEGEEALSTSWSLATASGKVYEHPFVNFFSAATQMLRNLSPGDPEFEPILALYRIWLQRAKDSPAFSTSFGQKRLRDLQGFEIKQVLRMQRNMRAASKPPASSA